MSLFKHRDPEKWFAEQEEQEREIRAKGATLRGREDELLRLRKTAQPQLVINNDNKDD